MQTETDTEKLKKMIARTVATHPVGRNLMLIGGFRYRFLNSSVRTSDDIDYHWQGDLSEKQAELIEHFNRILLPEVNRTVGYDGSAAPCTGPDSDSLSVRTVNLAFWKKGIAFSRIEIPVEITAIICADPVCIRTVTGTIYATVSDADMIESKIIAVFNRVILKHRDIVDVFLFKDSLLQNSSQRLAAKLQRLGISNEHICKRVDGLREHSEYQIRAIQDIIDTQFDSVAANQINDAGGGRMILRTVLDILKDLGVAV
jgi:predicted nucleotidyltransferase component of viral defense system